MALRFIDSFDHYDRDDLLRKWTGGSLGTSADVDISSANARNGAQSLVLYDDGFYVQKTIDNQATWIVGFGFYFTNTLISLSRGLAAFVDGSTQQAELQLNLDGTLEIRRGGSSTTGGTAVTDGKSVLTISAGTWNFIEIKITIANSIGAGSCVVKVNGATYLTVATGQDLQITANAYANAFRLGFLNTGGILGSTPWYFDDVYICDATGGVNDDFLGDCRVEYRAPNGNGTVNQFTGSDADSTDNYLHVDEVPPDDDTSYVEDSTPGNQDLYAIANLSASPATIFGVQTNIMAKKDDAGSRSVMALIRSSGITYDGEINALSQGFYENHHSIDEVNPNTTNPWTEADFNSAEFGLEVV